MTKLTAERLETMSDKKLLRLMVKCAQAYDKLGNKWNMDIWLRRGNGVCVGCLAGAMLHFIGGEVGPNMRWMRRVNALRLGLVPDRKWFKANAPKSSAAHGDAWNPDEDPAFYTEFARRL